MTVDVQRWNKKRRRLWLATAALAALLAIIVVPPLVSISGYKSRIIRLMSEALGRPVRLSSVELRLFPRPGFVLTDLSVEEDPAYGAEPVLHAETVTASIRLASLWRGRGEISIRCSAQQPRGQSLRRGTRDPDAEPRRCPTWRQPTPASTSSAARRSCRSRWWLRIFPSGRNSRATGA